MNESKIPSILETHETVLLDEWQAKLAAANVRKGLLKESELQAECHEFLSLLRVAVQQGSLTNIRGPEWQKVQAMLAKLSQSRFEKGFTTSETAMFVFSFKQPLFSQLSQQVQNPIELGDEIWRATTLLDQLGLVTMEAYQKIREDIILRQQEELLELSTPVVQLWEGILALPIIGTLDSARTQSVMESLLQTIVDTRSEVAIIDITGVPTVDTVTAKYLLKTVTAARLMGAECIISGIRPQIAQTIVYLGIDLSGVLTRATLADAFVTALKHLGTGVSRPDAPQTDERGS